MHQDRGGSDQDMKQNQQQDRRLKPLTGENQQQQPSPPPQQHPPQKCPRCESLNTKFCYYNNYSLSQPRYFCKTCRRYWTQGGTLRNVPVGGGCRKGKRTKISSAAENLRSQPHISQQQPNMIPSVPQTLISSSNPLTSVTSALRIKEQSAGSLASSSNISSVGSYYPGGGFLSAIQSINQAQLFNQPLHQGLSLGGGDSGGPSNLGLLQGYGDVHPFGSQPQFFNMGNRDQKSTVNVYPSNQQGLIQSAASGNSAQTQQINWHQSFLSNSTITNSEAALWSINTNNSSRTSNAGITNTSTTTVVSSLNQNQWPNLPGYGAPP